MDDDHIRVRNRVKGMSFVTLLATRRALTPLPWRLGAAKPVHRGRATAVPAVLVQLGSEFGNLSLQASVLVTEVCDETLVFRDEPFEILDGCKKNRDISNGVLRERSILNIRSGIGDISSHYILSGCNYKKILRLGLNSYENSRPSCVYCRYYSIDRRKR
jgi:hypothetical protein